MPLDIAPFIRDVPDFPKPGIIFKDITPLLANGPVFRQLIEEMVALYRDAKITHVVAVESRGFIFGSAIAAALGAGFVPVRKPKKLPHRTFREEYTLEYGTDSLEIHEDAFIHNEAHPRVLIVDDVLATGGTMEATIKLVKRSGAKIHEVLCLIELSFLNGRPRLGATPFRAWMVV